VDELYVSQKMYVAEVISNSSISDIVGINNVVLILICAVYALAISVFAIIKANNRLLITPLIISLSAVFWMNGINIFHHGMSLYVLAMEYTSTDPFLSMMDAGVIYATLGASLLLLCVTGVSIFLSFVVIQFRNIKSG